MISISGIKYQEELEKMPYFNKNEASVLIGKNGKNLDKKIAQLTKIGYLKNLKKGLYVSSTYTDKVDLEPYSEYVANILRTPSYISTEYILAKQGLIPESVFALTSITLKTPRNYSNFIGNFYFRNIKEELFCGFESRIWSGITVYVSTKAKALFDYYYLKKMRNIKADVFDARINWEEFKNSDIAEFEKYVTLSKSTKMKRVLEAVKKYNDTF